MEWGTTMGVLVVLFIVVFFTKKYGLFCNTFMDDLML